MSEQRYQEKPVFSRSLSRLLLARDIFCRTKSTLNILGHLNSLPYFPITVNKSLFLPVDVSKTAERIANSADPGQATSSVASDLDLHCLSGLSVPLIPHTYKGVKMRAIVCSLLCAFNPCHAERIKIPRPFPAVSQSDYLIQIPDINSHTGRQTVQIQISWLLQKPTDLDLHCLQRHGIYGFSRTRVKTSQLYDFHAFLIHHYVNKPIQMY